MFIEKKSCEKCIVYGEGNIKKDINAIEKGGLRIAIVLDKGNQLQGTIFFYQFFRIPGMPILGHNPAEFGSERCSIVFYTLENPPIGEGPSS